MGDISHARGARRRVDDFIGNGRALLVPDIALQNLEELHACAQQLGALGHSRHGAVLGDFASTPSTASRHGAFGAQLCASTESQYHMVTLDAKYRYNLAPFRQVIQG